ncbi:unnamed protein product [Pedinophyceae sp. YPF-701]|nr:unnamed protein product [Pedinophyceae sp. YPF-701]
MNLSDAVHDATSREPQEVALEDLYHGGGGPLGHVVARLPPRDRARLAAASTALFATLLACVPRAKWASNTPVGRDVLARLHRRGTESAAESEGRESSNAYVGWTVADGACRVFCRPGADPDAPASIVGIEVLKAEPPRPISAEMTGLQFVDVSVKDATWLADDDWLPEGVRVGITHLRGRGGPLRRVPEGLANLQELHLGRSADFFQFGNTDDMSCVLPASSAGRLRTLVIDRAELVCVPETAQALESLAACGCSVLDGNTATPGPQSAFLSESRARRLRKLDLRMSPVRRLPAGMESLEELHLVHCERLVQVGFLPESSARRLRTLDTTFSPVKAFPENMECLESLDVSFCPWLDVDASPGRPWLPASSARRLRSLTAGKSRLNAVPAGAVALEELVLPACLNLQPEAWIDPAVAANLRVLDLSGTSLARLPENMTRLERLDVSMAHTLDGGGDAWLPETSRKTVRVLNAERSCVARVPEGMASLEEVNLTGCQMRAAWMPESSARRLRVLSVAHTNIERVPSAPETMRNLTELSVRRCRRLATDWLPAGLAQHVTKLDIGRTDLKRVPPDMTSLQELDISYNTKLARDGWLPESSAGRLRTLVAKCSALRRVPDCIPSGLEELVVAHCEGLDVDAWLPEQIAAGLRRLDVAATKLRRLPPGMCWLEEVDVGECRMLADDWGEALPTCARRLPDKTWEGKALIPKPSLV